MQIPANFHFLLPFFIFATVSLFSIVGSWNDFFSGLIYMQKVENYPIMTYLARNSFLLFVIAYAIGTVTARLRASARITLITENRSIHSRVRVTVIYGIVLLLGLSCLFRC